VDIVIGEFLAEGGHLLFAVLDDFFKLRVTLLLNCIRRKIRRTYFFAHVGLGMAVGSMAADTLFLEDLLSRPEKQELNRNLGLLMSP